MKSTDLNDHSPYLMCLCVYDLSWGLGLHVPELWMSDDNFWELVFPHFWRWVCFVVSSAYILQVSWPMGFWVFPCLHLLSHSWSAGMITVYHSTGAFYVGPRNWTQVIRMFCQPESTDLRTVQSDCVHLLSHTILIWTPF